jgi:hypothetical protein
MAFSTFNSFTGSFKNQIIKSIVNIVQGPEYSFRVIGTSSTVPTTSTNRDGTLSIVALRNSNNVEMFNDSTRGFVFKLSGSNYLAISFKQESSHTKTFWVSSSTPSFNSGNVFSSSTFPIYFDGSDYLKIANFQGRTIISSVPQTSVWIFYAVTVSPTTTSLYINGNLDQTIQCTFNSLDEEIQFGAYKGLSYYLGLLDDMRLYPSILTPQEISKMYYETK